MSARHKLNVAFLQGSLVLAAALGAMARSWTIFGLALAVLVVGGLYGGDIRPRGRGR